MQAPPVVLRNITAEVEGREDLSHIEDTNRNVSDWIKILCEIKLLVEAGNKRHSTQENMRLKEQFQSRPPLS